MTIDDMIAVLQGHEEGCVIESRYKGQPIWAFCPHPVFNFEMYDYRVQLTQDSVDWSHVGKHLNAHARDRSGAVHFFDVAPRIISDYWHPDCDGNKVVISAYTFSSFVRGTCDWKDSLVLRPKDE